MMTELRSLLTDLRQRSEVQALSIPARSANAQGTRGVDAYPKRGASTPVRGRSLSTVLAQGHFYSDSLGIRATIKERTTAMMMMWQGTKFESHICRMK